MRKLALIFTLICMTGTVFAADAVLSSPDEIVLNSGNSYSVTKTYDGSASSPESAKYEWFWQQNSSEDSGEEASFTFTRANDQTNTIKLTVSSESDSDTAQVTQTLRDEPEVLSVPDDRTIDLDTDETFKADDYSIKDTFDSDLSYSWDLDSPDSDDDTGSGESFTHTYNELGTYNLELNVSDEEGYYTVASEVDIEVQNSSEEDNNDQQNQQNQQAQNQQADDSVGFDESFLLGTVASGDAKEASFDNSPVTSVEIDFSADGSSVELKSAAAEEQEDLPNGVDEDPDGVSYRFMEFEKVNFNDGDVESVSFEFEVEKDWIEDNEIVRDTIDLQRYSDGWSKLGAAEVDEDDEDIYYEADAPGLSVFSITGEEAETSFSVESVEISPGQVDPGENFTVNITVENAGNIAGEYNLSFELAGESFEDTLSLDPGSSENAEFTTSVSENGSYSVEVGDSSASVQVGQVEEQAEEEEQQQEQDEGFGLLIPVVALLIVLSIGALAFYVFTDSMARQMMIERVEEFFTGEDEEEGALSSDDYSFT